MLIRQNDDSCITATHIVKVCSMNQSRSSNLSSQKMRNSTVVLKPRNLNGEETTLSNLNRLNERQTEIRQKKENYTMAS